MTVPECKTLQMTLPECRTRQMTRLEFRTQRMTLPVEPGSSLSDVALNVKWSNTS